jgi:hypothetical protein
VALTSKDPKKPGSPNAPAIPGTSAEDEILMREIDDAVRQDDTTEFLRKYGVALGVALALGLAAFGGWLAWDWYSDQQLQEQSETLVAGLDRSAAQDYDATDETVTPLLESGEPGPRTAARFLLASSALERGDTARAVQLFGEIAADEGAPSALRDLARVREVATNFDEREPADVIAKLKSLAVPGNPFFGSAGELTAIAHLEAGNRDKAGTLFAAIAKDDQLPETLRSRARQMAGLLGVDAVEDVDALLKAEGIDPEAGLGPQAGLPAATRR